MTGAARREQVGAGHGRRSLPRLCRFVTIGLACIALWSGCSSTSPSCVYTVSPISISVPANGGSGTVAVTAGGGCTWSAVSGASWLTITSGATGTGNGTVGFTATANGAAARAATITVASQPINVLQEGLPAQAYTLSGTVTDVFLGPTGRMPGVSVTLTGGPSQGSATTDFVGNYTIPGLLAGTYIVTFAKAGYVTTSATTAISGAAWLSVSLSLDVPASPSTSNLTGYWSGTGSYPNDPFKLALIQTGNQLRGKYVDRYDASLSVTGTASSPEFTLRVDFGDAILFLECAIQDAREVKGVQRTSALGNRPYPFEMRR